MIEWWGEGGEQGKETSISTSLLKTSVPIQKGDSELLASMENEPTL